MNYSIHMLHVKSAFWVETVLSTLDKITYKSLLLNDKTQNIIALTLCVMIYFSDNDWKTIYKYKCCSHFMLTHVFIKGE